MYERAEHIAGAFVVVATEAFAAGANRAGHTQAMPGSRLNDETLACIEITQGLRSHGVVARPSTRGSGGCVLSGRWKIDMSADNTLAGLCLATPINSSLTIITSVPSTCRCNTFDIAGKRRCPNPALSMNSNTASSCIRPSTRGVLSRSTAEDTPAIAAAEISTAKVTRKTLDEDIAIAL